MTFIHDLTYNLFSNILVQKLEVVYLIFFHSPCHHVTVLPFLFQNGLVTSSPEMFKLKSCIRRKTDSIDKRFCFDIEVVERFELFFIFFNKLNYLFLCLGINMKPHRCACVLVSLKAVCIHVHSFTFVQQRYIV